MGFLDLIEKRPGFAGSKLVSVIHGHRLAPAWVVERGRIYFPTKSHLPELAFHTFTEDEAKRAVQSMLRYALYNGLSDGGRQVHGLVDWLRPALSSPEVVPFNGIDRSVDSRLVGWTRRAARPCDFTQAMADVTQDIRAQYRAPPTHWLVNHEQAIEDRFLEQMSAAEDPGFRVQLVREPECPYGRGFVITASTWRLHHLGDELISGFSGEHPWISAFYGNLVCSAPWLNGSASVSA